MMNALENSIVYMETDDSGKLIRLVGKGKAKDFQRKKC